MHESLEFGQRGRWLSNTFSIGVSSTDIYEHQTPCAARPLVINRHIMAGKQKSHSAPTETSRAEVERKVKWLSLRRWGGVKDARRRRPRHTSPLQKAQTSDWSPPGLNMDSLLRAARVQEENRSPLVVFERLLTEEDGTVDWGQRVCVY